MGFWVLGHPVGERGHGGERRLGMADGVEAVGHGVG